MGTDSKHVVLRGSFSNWNDIQLHRDDGGYWSAREYSYQILMEVTTPSRVASKNAGYT